MGWGNCGQDSQGRSIGYMHDGTCDHPGCNKEVNRGVGHACGGMHGDLGGEACEGYFCYEHLTMIDKEATGFTQLWSGQLCQSCTDDGEKILREMLDDGYHELVGDLDLISEKSKDEIVPYIMAGDVTLEYKADGGKCRA